MKASLLSWGAVTPAGFGKDAVDRAWPLSEVKSGSGRPCLAGLVNREAEALTQWEKEPRLRRASPLTYYMVEATHQALEKAPQIDRSRTGVIATFFLGCLVYSVRFYRQVTEQGRRFGAPVLFPETVFNSPLSHVVATLGLGGPVYSQIGDKSCWATALRTAQCWLSNGDADHVLVLGGEEFEAHELDALRAGGLLRHGLVPAEGAAAVLLGGEGSDNSARINTLAEGFTFTGKDDAGEAAKACLNEFPTGSPILETSTGWTKKMVKEASAGHRVIPSPFTQVDGFTISTACDTIRAAQKITAGEENEIIVPYWGLTTQCSAALLDRG